MGYISSNLLIRQSFTCVMSRIQTKIQLLFENEKRRTMARRFPKFIALVGWDWTLLARDCSVW